MCTWGLPVPARRRLGRTRLDLVRGENVLPKSVSCHCTDVPHSRHRRYLSYSRIPVHVLQK